MPKKAATAKSTRSKVKVKDLKPRKDAKGGYAQLTARKAGKDQQE